MKPGLAVEAKEIEFVYRTPKKIPLFGNFPFKRITYVDHVALDRVSLDIHSNRITALLGRNGSGKTTLIKIISGVRLPKSGSLSVFGFPPQNAKSRIGLCMGASLIYHRLTARENLEYFGRLYNVHRLGNRIDELSHLLQLDGHLDDLVETYSFGMKMKLAIARSMIHSPDLLILDEPTLGIDAELARSIRDFIRKLDCTILLTTHYLEEAEELADDICIIESGRILNSGSKAKVLSETGTMSIPEAFLKVMAKHPPLRSAS